ncbi:MAG: twin-arginine translocation signal domain-containing protein [Candidatus Competibacteraceae bacterium]|nr:twin-arginine translocation signal domain-containing protein [Candidatus Competibacteraceae bacterium]
MKEKQTTTTRRGFLQGTLTVGGATLMGAAVGQAQAAVPQPQEQPGKQGYHETQHIRDYYSTARL